MKRIALTLGMLVAVVACDKARAIDAASDAQAANATESIDLSKQPEIVFQLFGERDDPRMIPIAAIVGGALQPIELSDAGWHRFDAMYARAGTSYPLYRDGSLAGSASVRRGMWSAGEEPLYSLPGCSRLRPLSAVTLATAATVGYTVEFLATTPGLTPAIRPTVTPSPELEAAAREAAHETVRNAGLSEADLDEKSFRYAAIRTGASESPTLVAWYLDLKVEGQVASTHVMVVSDRKDGGWEATYALTGAGPVGQREFRRYVDHLDVDGDGVDELLMEGWRFGGDTYPIILSLRVGKWTEVFHGRASWCLDPQAP
ncbi:MAG TPA: hypothetical protein VFG84_03000 [Gemmatimonadaceae bacterium]|nr:hypothetical protein [Gemmatimonadaceae bacterium]